MRTKIFYDFEATGVARTADPVSIGLAAITEEEYYEHNVEFISENELRVTSDIKEIKTFETKTFYAEFTDFNKDKADDWVKENIIGKLKYKQNEQKSFWFMEDSEINHYFGYGNINQVSLQLKQWLSQFESIEFWADFDVIDKPMLIDLISDWDYQNKESKGFSTITAEYYSIIEDNYKIGLPKHLPNIRYDQFFDLHTLFKIKGIDTDINREEFAFGDIAFKDDKGELLYNVPVEFSKLGKHNSLYDSYVNWKIYNKLMSI